MRDGFDEQLDTKISHLNIVKAGGGERILFSR